MRWTARGIPNARISPRGYEEGSSAGYGMGEIQRDVHYALEYGATPQPKLRQCAAEQLGFKKIKWQRKLQEFRKQSKPEALNTEAMPFDIDQEPIEKDDKETV